MRVDCRVPLFFIEDCYYRILPFAPFLYYVRPHLEKPAFQTLLAIGI